MADSVSERTMEHVYLYCGHIIGSYLQRMKRATHIQIHPSVNEILKFTFMDCTALKRIDIPSSVKVIGNDAFRGCKQLVHVELNEGLEHIGKNAFRNCISLERIHLPGTLKMIGEKSFSGCVKLTEVTLSEGLRNISNDAFCRCLSLKRITIPSTVYSIHKRAFSKCPKLVAVKFSEEIEALVCYPREMQRNWWNEGVPKHALRVYCLLAGSNIPKRLAKLRVEKWRIQIETMIKRLPSIPSKDLESYHESIVSKLAVYERLQKIVPLLELAIWKSKLVEEFPTNDAILSDKAIRLHHRINCGASVIIPNVVSFLLMDRLPRKSVL
ncbi:hypothetical protein ACHAWU_009952 [Discostella pseudostelligera]|uniref:Leucine-rich repeat domain, L domain-containing protein n=1 Tax=Discostella pseudostelligera TaxID=259834 RepID=A0ABD3LXU9_9STRA